jgi:hypothetical protein
MLNKEQQTVSALQQQLSDLQGSLLACMHRADTHLETIQSLHLQLGEAQEANEGLRGVNMDLDNKNAALEQQVVDAEYRVQELELQLACTAPVDAAPEAVTAPSDDEPFFLLSFEECLTVAMTPPSPSPEFSGQGLFWACL